MVENDKVGWSMVVIVAEPNPIILLFKVTGWLAVDNQPRLFAVLVIPMSIKVIYSHLMMVNDGSWMVCSR